MQCVSGSGLKAHANGRAGSRRRTKRNCRNHLYALPPTALHSLAWGSRLGDQGFGDYGLLREQWCCYQLGTQYRVMKKILELHL